MQTFVAVTIIVLLLCILFKEELRYIILNKLLVTTTDNGPFPGDGDNIYITDQEMIERPENTVIFVASLSCPHCAKAYQSFKLICKDKIGYSCKVFLVKNETSANIVRAMQIFTVPKYIAFQNGELVSLENLDMANLNSFVEKHTTIKNVSEEQDSHAVEPPQEDKDNADTKKD